MSGPPRLARLLLAAALPAEYRPETLGDLEEGYRRRVAVDGVVYARRWYRGQALRSLPPALALRWRELRDSWMEGRTVGGGMDDLLQDLRYGLRSMMRKPGFAVVATGTLALAIGVNTAIFSLVTNIVYADMPMREPGTSMIIRSVNTATGDDDISVSWPDYLDFRERVESFESLAALGNERWVLTGAEEPVRVTGFRATANLLENWDRQPRLGRGFLPEDGEPGAPPVAMLSYSFWQGYFGADPDVLGRTIQLDGTEHTIVGVLPREVEFASLADGEVWAPIRFGPTDRSRDQRELYLMGRLAPGVGAERARQEVRAVGRALAEEHPEAHTGWGFDAKLIRDDLIDSDGRTILVMLSLTVVFVLLLACANVANMLLVRATKRTREMAVRTALGAGRGRLVRQLLTEATVVALAAGALGLALAKGLIESMVWLSRGREFAFSMATLDGRVLLFTLGVSLLAPLAFGLVPALRASATDVGDALKEGAARSGGGRRTGRTRSLLVGAQIALAIMLMAVASLLSRTVINLQSRPLGFEPEHVLTFRIGLPEHRYDEPGEARRFYRDLVRELRDLPAAEDVALASFRPAVDYAGQRPIQIEGGIERSPEERPGVVVATVSPGFFELLELPLLRGRTVRDSDRADATPVALVSRETARRYFGGDDPIGRRIRLGADPDADWIQVVGVVDDVRSMRDRAQPEPYVYVPFDQATRARMVVMIRAAGDAAALADPARDAVWRIDPGQPVDDVRTLTGAIADNEAGRTALLSLFIVFALFALVMAGIGIYGVMSFSVSQRDREIAIRVALGAESGSVRRMILSHGARLLVLGTIAGLGGAFVIGRMLSGVLFQVTPTDPVTFVGVPLVLGAVALLANWIPAWRATRIQPMEVLRVE